MNTRKCPRTMQEAFGPYTSSQLEPMQEADNVVNRERSMKRKMIDFLAACTMGAVLGVMMAYGLDYQLQIEEAADMKAAAERQAEEGAAK